MKEETIREHQVVEAHYVMVQDLREKNKSRIRTLHEMIDPDYKKLRRNRRENLRPSFGSVDTVIYYDILDLICEGLKENSFLRKTFIELYSSSYPNTNKVISKMQTLSNVEVIDYVSSHQEDVSMSYAIFVLGEMDEFNNSPIWLSPISKEAKKKDMYYEVRKFYSQPRLKNSGESVIESAAYKEYLVCNRRKIAELLECKESKLSAEINSIIINGLEQEKASINNGTPEMTTRIERKLLMAHHQGAAWIFIGMLLKNPSWFKSYYYKPDVDQIIDDFYSAKAITEYYTKPHGYDDSYLREKLITDTPRRDLEEILMLCNTDIIYKMYDVLMDMYYEGFSWDKKVDDASRSMIAARIKGLENEIERLDSADYDETLRLYESENKRLRNQIEELEKQNQKKLELIEAQTELIDSMQHSEEESKEEIDVNRLQACRYLFAGFLDTYLTELRSLFPNSVFMTSETRDITGIQVDYIIVVTKYISHSMYYKVKSSQIYSESPCLMCNATSINGVLNDMNQFVTLNEKI